MELYVWREHDSPGTVRRSHFLTIALVLPKVASLVSRCFHKKIFDSVLATNDKMIQTTSTPTTARFLLLRLLTLWVVLLAVTAADVTTPPSRRQGVRQKCSRTCPGRAPIPNASCCYTGTDDCNYNHVYMWDVSCENIRCVPVTMCECGPDPRNANRRAWNCALQRRRELAAMECPVTEETPVATARLASSVGRRCIP